jgi:PAS domain S-box-containing protein
MTWLAIGVIYSLAYVTVGSLIDGLPTVQLWFRAVALLIPPLAGVLAIVVRRHTWTGCQWLFWATIVLGLMMSAIGQLGWTVDEVLLGRVTSWLGWHAVFALFGAVAPLLALLAQPHRGPRERAAATTAVDIAGIAVLTGFLYSHFVVGPDLSPLTTERPSPSLVLLSELQQLLVVAGMAAAMFVARHSSWNVTYRRLALGQLVSFVTLTLSNLEIWQASYRTASVVDFIWILPFAFYPWAASAAPSSAEAVVDTVEADQAPSRPWVIFSGLALIPLIDYLLRVTSPADGLGGFRDLSTAVTVVSVLPLLMARLAVERAELHEMGAELRKVDSKAQLLAAAVEHADELVVIISQDLRVEHANEAFCRALGYDLKELIGMDSYQLVAEETRAQLDETDRRVRENGVWRGTHIRCRKDGTTFPSATAVVPLADADGTVTHFVRVERDISEETRLRDQLIHSERLSAVGQLVSGVAHELNNPLQSILGFTELLIETDQKQQDRRDLEQIRAEAVRAGKIVRNLLAFVRRSSAERSLHAMSDLVRSTVALRAYEFKTANITLEEDYVAGLPSVWVNREEIQQVILNLILNAEQAMRTTNSGGRLVLRTRLIDSNVVLEVHDSGPGIPAKLAGRVFEPFFSTKGVGEGTGLGLSIALGIAEAHGGMLAIIPTDCGACFRLTIPASQPAGSVVAVGAAPGQARRVLVADDEPILRAMLQRMLMRRGYGVDMAVDGEVALTLLETRRYDLIFCDVKLPKMGGLALHARIADRYPGATRGFVFVASDRLDGDSQSFIDRTRIPLLSKPFTADRLDDLLNRLQTLAAV